MAQKTTNIERLQIVLELAKAGKVKTKEYKKHLAHLEAVLTPVVKGTTCREILELCRQGYSNAEIVAQGYNKVTVARQTKEYRTKTTFAISLANEEFNEESEE